MPRRSAPPLDRLMGEVRLTFHVLKAAAEALHAGDGGLLAGHRGVLESLYEKGPQTVPALARARPVSRQHIQVLANHLLGLELVESVPNPASRRSPLLRITPAGRRRFERMLVSEHRALATVRRRLPEKDLEQAARTLGRLRAELRTVVSEPDT